MKFLFIISLFLSLLYASNPRVYSALGDTIYDNAPKIAKLQQIKQYLPFKQKIEKYVLDVEKTKQLGFAIESGEKKSKARDYLLQLRALAKQNDFYVRSAESLFLKALKTNDYETVMDLLDTGIIDLDRYREKLLQFYSINKDRIVLRGEFARIVQEELKKRSKHSKEYYLRLKKMKEQEKIRRLRLNDKKRQEELQRKLEEELKRKKEQIEKEQKEELQQG